MPELKLFSFPLILLSLSVISFSQSTEANANIDDANSYDVAQLDREDAIENPGDVISA